MPPARDLDELREQIVSAIVHNQRTCLLCFHYVLAEKGTIVRCTERLRVWEYADRLSPQHEVKCLHRARNCKTFEPEERQDVEGFRRESSRE